MDSVEKLVKALTNKGDHKLDGTIRKARAGQFSDTLSESATPIMDLVIELTRLGHPDLAQRAKNGEFDATHEEWEAWQKSPEGRATFAEFFGGVNKGTDTP